jgi:hypothetical protein
MYVALQIPMLTQTYKDADVGAKVTKFLTCAQPLINLVIKITKDHEWTPQETWERRDELTTQDESFFVEVGFALKLFCY